MADLSRLSDEELLSLAGMSSGDQNPMMSNLIRQESGGNPNAISPKGAQGIVQIMPATARDPGYGVMPLQNWDGANPMTAPVDEQIRFGNDYINAMQNKFGSPQLAAAAYNAGPGAVENAGGDISRLPQETQNYVPRVAGNFTIKQQPQFDIASLSDEELLRMAGMSRPQQVQQQEAPKAEGPTLMQRLGSDYDARRAKVTKLADQTVNGDISIPEAAIRSGLNIASLPFDAIGSGIAQITPDFVKEPLTDAIARAANTDTGRSVVNAVNDFNQNHPVASGRIGSVFDAANLLVPFAKVGGQGVATAVGDAALETGKLAGKAIAPVGKLAGKAVSAIAPSVDEGLVDVAKKAQKFNIPLSYDQITTSNAAKNVQKISKELPLSGQASFRNKQMTAYNKALFNTVGIDADKFTPQNMARAFEMVGGEFDALTSGKKFNIGEDFINELAKSADEISSTYGQEAANVFQREAGKVINDFAGDEISGELIGRQRARINALARKANPEIKGALLDLENAIVDGITSKDPGIRKALSDAKQKYKNLIVLEPLAAKAKGGNISPAQLNNRVARVYGRAHTIGKSGDIGDLARIGNELLPELGGSDTAQKLLYYGGTAASLSNPVTATMAAGGALANRALQSGLNRNQKLIYKALSAAEKKQLMQLPPAEAMRLLEGQQ